MPCLPQVDNVAERLVRHSHGPVADDQHRVGRALKRRNPKRQLFHQGWPHPMHFVEPDPRQNLARSRAGIKRRADSRCSTALG